MTAPLDGIRVLDLTRVLAGPLATQILGDLGATVIKVERPGAGDDTRSFPPFLQDDQGQDTSESAYYLGLNRNKQSITLDLSTPQAQAKIHDLLSKSDVLVENFRVGSLKKLGLGYDDLKTRYPRLIYASITGFGQTGPLATEPGYDFIAQGMSGLMSATGAPGSVPTKVGVAIGDYVTGLYTTIAVLAALRARDLTGRGQHLDLSLLDCTLATMTHVAMDYLVAGVVPPKVGNAHASIVPYQDFKTRDGHVIIAAANDRQFKVLAGVMGYPAWADDPRFKTNAARVLNRDDLLALMNPVIAARTTADWVDMLRAADIAVGPIYRVDQAFNDPQIIARGMVQTVHHPYRTAPVKILGSPLKFSDTPVVPPTTPPIMGQDTKGDV